MKYFTLLFVFALLFSSCGAPLASFQYGDGQLTAPDAIQFENASKKADEYEWNFGDGTTSKEEQPTHRFRESGNYTVTLKAKKGSKENITKKTIQVEAPKECMVILDTDYGSMYIELFNDTPLHRDNFLKLIEEGYYEDLLFHRVIEGFMLQGGDPNSRNAPQGARLGNGGPDYKVPAEITPNRVHFRGALAAARDNNPEKASSGSQFYIVQGRKTTEEELKKNAQRNGIRYSKDILAKYVEVGGASQLDNEYTVFGQVIEGLDVIDKIAALEKDKNDRPKENVKMKLSVVY